MPAEKPAGAAAARKRDETIPEFMRPIPLALLSVYFIGLFVASLAVIYRIITIGESGPSTAGAGPDVLQVSQGNLLLAVVAAGVVGSLVHGMASLTSYRGNRRLYASWGLWYVMRPIGGAAMAILFYLGIRGGLLVMSTGETTSVDPYAMMLVAGLAGMFSKQAGDKMAEVFDSLFGARADSERKDKLAKAAPKIGKLAPASVEEGSGAVNLVVTGESFIVGSRARFEGAPRATLVMSDKEIHATLTDADTAKAGTFKVTVVHPEDGGGASEPADFVVTARKPSPPDAVEVPVIVGEGGRIEPQGSQPPPEE